MKIAIVCFDNFTDIDVFLPWDLLNRVRLVGGISDWDVQLLGTEETHISMSGAHSHDKEVSLIFLLLTL